MRVESRVKVKDMKEGPQEDSVGGTSSARLTMWQMWQMPRALGLRGGLQK